MDKLENPDLVLVVFSFNISGTSLYYFYTGESYAASKHLLRRVCVCLRLVSGFSVYFKEWVQTEKQLQNLVGDLFSMKAFLSRFPCDFERVAVRHGIVRIWFFFIYFFSPVVWDYSWKVCFPFLKWIWIRRGMIMSRYENMFWAEN